MTFGGGKGGEARTCRPSRLGVEGGSIRYDLGGLVAVVLRTAEVAGVAGEQNPELHLAAQTFVLTAAVGIARRLGGAPGRINRE